MKIKPLLLLPAVLFFMSVSCKRDDPNIDCLKESILAKLERTARVDDPKTVDFTIDYTGTWTINSVDWDFGDGIKESTNGISTTHTYADTGIYTIKADVNVELGNDFCTWQKEKNVRIK